MISVKTGHGKSNMIIDCFFCKTKLPWIGSWGGATEEISWLQYRCKDCKVSYDFNKFIGQITDYKIQGDPYWIDINLTDGSCEILYPHNIADPDSPIRWETIAKLATTPANLTPQNVNERLKTLVLFS